MFLGGPELKLNRNGLLLLIPSMMANHREITHTGMLAAAGAGIIGRLVEHPFDTVKVRMQAARSNPMSFRSLYRGLPMPLLASMLEVTTLFTAHGHISVRASSLGVEGRCNTLLSGGAAGALAATILTPTELVKCRMQIDAQKGYRSSWDCLKRSLRNDGPGVLFRGHTATLAREIPGTAAWFLSSQESRRWLKDRRGREEPWHAVAGGAIAGICYTTILFPADTIKTRLQTLPGPGPHPIAPVARAIMSSKGPAGLYAGWLPAVLKSVPASAAIFGSHAYLSEMLRDKAP